MRDASPFARAKELHFRPEARLRLDVPQATLTGLTPLGGSRIGGMTRRHNLTPERQLLAPIEDSFQHAIPDHHLRHRIGQEVFVPLGIEIEALLNLKVKLRGGGFSKTNTPQEIISAYDEVNKRIGIIFKRFRTDIVESLSLNLGIATHPAVVALTKLFVDLDREMQSDIATANQSYTPQVEKVNFHPPNRATRRNIERLECNFLRDALISGKLIRIGGAISRSMLREFAKTFPVRKPLAQNPSNGGFQDFGHLNSTQSHANYAWPDFKPDATGAVRTQIASALKKCAPLLDQSGHDYSIEKIRTPVGVIAIDFEEPKFINSKVKLVGSLVDRFRGCSAPPSFQNVNISIYSSSQVEKHLDHARTDPYRFVIGINARLENQKALQLRSALAVDNGAELLRDLLDYPPENPGVNGLVTWLRTGLFEPLLGAPDEKPKNWNKVPVEIRDRAMSCYIISLANKVQENLEKALSHLG